LVVAGGAGGVGDGLRIEAELVEVAAGAVRGQRWWCTWGRSRRLRWRGFGSGGAVGNRERGALGELCGRCRRVAVSSKEQRGRDKERAGRSDTQVGGEQ
jgi:hypothetical protein